MGGMGKELEGRGREVNLIKPHTCLYEILKQCLKIPKKKLKINVLKLKGVTNSVGYFKIEVFRN